jgi:hypothetical protein
MLPSLPVNSNKNRHNNKSQNNVTKIVSDIIILKIFSYIFLHILLPINGPDTIKDENNFIYEKKVCKIPSLHRWPPGGRLVRFSRKSFFCTASLQPPEDNLISCATFTLTNFEKCSFPGSKLYFQLVSEEGRTYSCEGCRIHCTSGVKATKAN